MRNNYRSALLTLAVLGGVYVIRNRSSIQRRFNMQGVGSGRSRNLLESARAIASRFRGKMDQGATIAESLVDRVAS